eukprot:9948438-Prorocentrum_lima.AAC.1
MAQRYFRSRPKLGALRPLGWGATQKLVAAAHNSAPGLDNIPYEALHPATELIAALIGQANHAAHNGNQQLLIHTLGESEDLAVWIPKEGDTTSPNALRPLQLPTTVRRLYAATLAE